tara:strand:- start:2331 stop:2561 length:231 start_codon:yes stop_codon:yes gene_type:complete
LALDGKEISLCDVKDPVLDISNFSFLLLDFFMSFVLYINNNFLGISVKHFFKISEQNYFKRTIKTNLVVCLQLQKK